MPDSGCISIPTEQPYRKLQHLQAPCICEKVDDSRREGPCLVADVWPVQSRVLAMLAQKISVVVTVQQLVPL